VFARLGVQRHLPARPAGAADREAGLVQLVDEAQALQDRGVPQEPRDHERDLLLVVPDDDGVEGLDGFGDGVAADLLYLGSEQVLEPGAGRDDEQALGEQEEIDREQAGEVLVLFLGWPDAGMPVIDGDVPASSCRPGSGRQ
jgi:hypothetical protein